MLLCVTCQVEVMKSNVESRVKNYGEQLEKFSARWHQLKPGDDVLDGDRKAALAAVQSIKERKQEFDELELTRQALMSVTGEIIDDFTMFYMYKSLSKTHFTLDLYLVEVNGNCDFFFAERTASTLSCRRQILRRLSS